MYGRGKFVVRNIISAIVAVLIVTFSFLLIINLSFNMIYKKYDVWGYSMQPTLNADISSRSIDGDVVYINQFSEAKLNDVVVAHVKWNGNAVIKRLVGNPGDTVKITPKDDYYALYCNDQLMYTRPSNIETDSYFAKAQVYCQKFKNAHIDQDGSFCVELKDNQYFLLGDHWTGSMLDSMTSGPVKKSEIAGRVDIVIRYTEKNKMQSLGKSIIRLIFGKKVSL